VYHAASFGSSVGTYVTERALSTTMMVPSHSPSRRVGDLTKCLTGIDYRTSPCCTFKAWLWNVVVPFRESGQSGRLHRQSCTTIVSAPQNAQSGTRHKGLANPGLVRYICGRLFDLRHPWSEWSHLEPHPRKLETIYLRQKSLVWYVVLTYTVQP
jgi:hypothetical protein